MSHSWNLMSVRTTIAQLKLNQRGKHYSKPYMNQSQHVLLFGVSTVFSCVLGAVVLAFVPGDRSDRFVQPINTLLGTALPAAIAATAGAFQGMQQNQRADTIVTGGMNSEAPELPREPEEQQHA